MSLSKEDQERIEKIAAHDCGLTWPVIEENCDPSKYDYYLGLVIWMTEEHFIAYNKAIEDAVGLFTPVFKIDPKAENIILIIEAIKKAFFGIEKLKKPTLE